MVELVYMRLAKLGSKPQLVLAHGVGNNVCQMAGNVIAALRRSEPDLLKAYRSRCTPLGPGNDDVWRSQNGFPVDCCSRAQEQAHGSSVETVIEIVKDLVE